MDVRRGAIDERLANVRFEAIRGRLLLPVFVRLEYHLVRDRLPIGLLSLLQLSNDATGHARVDTSIQGLEHLQIEVLLCFPRKEMVILVEVLDQRLAVIDEARELIDAESLSKHLQNRLPRNTK